MKIALDGCDGTGKTSVAEKLANKLNCNIVRLTKDGDRSPEAYCQFMRCENVVHDRTFMSEIVYPKYFGTVSRLNDKDIPHYFKALDVQKVKTVILTASNDAILERIGKRGDEFITDTSKFKDINADYLRIASEHNFIVIDTTNKTIDEVVEEVIKHVC